MPPRRFPIAACRVALLPVVLVAACSGPSPHAGRGASSTTASIAVPTSGGTVRADEATWALPAPLTRPAVAPVDGHIVLLGGLTKTDTSTPRVLQVDPATGRSVAVGALGQPVHDAAGSVVGGLATVFGGGGARTIDAVQVLQGGSGRVIGHLPRPRSDLAAAAVGGTTYIVGGFDGSALTPEILATTDGSHFRTVGRLAQGVRYPAVATVGRSVWVLGGETGTAESASGTEVDLIQRFDADTGAVRVVGHLRRRLAHAMAFALGDHLYLAGGRTGSTPLDDISAISDAGTVTPAGRLPGPRADGGIAIIGDTAWLLGGETAGPTGALATVVAVSPG